MIYLGAASPALSLRRQLQLRGLFFIRLWTVTTLTIAATMVEALEAMTALTVGRAHPPRP
jgi:hypothetical protein